MIERKITIQDAALLAQFLGFQDPPGAVLALAVHLASRYPDIYREGVAGAKYECLIGEDVLLDFQKMGGRRTLVSIVR